MKSSAFDTSGLDLTPLQDKYSARERLLHFRGCNAFFPQPRGRLEGPHFHFIYCLKLQVAGCSYKLPVGFGVKAVIYNSGIVLSHVLILMIEILQMKNTWFPKTRTLLQNVPRIAIIPLFTFYKPQECLFT